MSIKRGEWEFDKEKTKRKKVELRYRCERCGKFGKRGKLEAHHRIPIRFAKAHPVLSVAMITSIKNCEILCGDCHKIADEEQKRDEKMLVTLAQSLFGIALIHT